MLTETSCGLYRTPRSRPFDFSLRTWYKGDSPLSESLDKWPDRSLNVGLARRTMTASARILVVDDESSNKMIEI